MSLRRLESRAVRSWLLGFALLGAVVSVTPQAAAEGTATPAEAAKAKKQIERGQALYKKGKLDEAYAAFSQAHDIAADPKATLMMARIQRDRGELLKAHETYQTALKEAQAAEAQGQSKRATADEIQRELRELGSVLGWLTIEVPHAPSGTRVSIDGRDVTAQLGSPIHVEPGPMVVEAKAPGGLAKEQKVTVKAGETANVEITFAAWSDNEAALAEDTNEKPAEREERDDDAKSKSSGGSRAPAYVAAGVGVAGLATFAVFGLLANSKYNELIDKCPDKQCPPDLEDTKKAGKTFQAIGNIGLIVGAAGAATAVTLFIIGKPSRPSSSARAVPAKVSLGLGTVALSGSFQ
jgi:tetratricopeptide (TPR) repeat protein